MLKHAVEILQVGFVGFAFLLAYLGFRLLRTEQSREDAGRPEILVGIRRFTYITLAFAFLAAGSSLAERLAAGSVETKSALRSEGAGTCRDGLDRLVNVDAKITKDYDSLVRAVHDAATGCQSILKALEEAK